MTNQFTKTKFWVYIFALYLVLGGIIISQINIILVSNLYVIGIFVILVILFIQIRKTDKVIAKDKKLKAKTEKNLKTLTRFFILKEIVFFILFVAYLLVLKFYNMDITFINIIVGGLALTIIYYILYKKGVLGFLDPKNMKK
jgi:hypothetical protein